jgi:ATP-binding cassette subfamily F protein uup
VAILVDLQKVHARLAERVLFADLSLSVSNGDRIGLVGINGTGKSTLLRVIAGDLTPDSGAVMRGKNTTIGYLTQEPKLPPGTVLNAVGEGWEARAILERLGLGAIVGREVTELSGGQAKRVALAQVLTHPCDLLILDEPTNHLDLAAVDWLEQRLATFRGGLVLVSHDRHLLDRVVNKMVELDRGHVHIHTGGYASYLDAKAVREDQAESQEKTRANLARRELAWLRRGAPARTRKPQARIDAAIKLVEGRKEAAARSEDLELKFGTPRLGDKVITCTDVSFTFDGATRPTLHDVSFDLDPRERLGIVGLNGTGKSTLLDLLVGRRSPTGGSIEVGTTVVTGYYDQHGVELDTTQRIRELVAGPTRAPGAPEDIALMERFWFTGDLPFARVGTLSGGERRRLQLLLVLASRPNVVFLDEPTNDLDLDTLRIVEDFFDDWPGALVVVSHDRTFLDRSVDRLLVVEDDGRVDPVVGGVAAFVDRLTGARSSVSTKPREQKPAKANVAKPNTVTKTKQRSASTLGRFMHEADKGVVRLTKERDRLLTEMGETNDYEKLADLGEEYALAQDRLAQAEMSWLELAEEAEANS